MSKQKFELPPPVEQYFVLPDHHSSHQTFGRLAVIQNENMVYDNLLEDHAQQHAKYAAQLESNIQPDRSNSVYNWEDIVEEPLLSDEPTIPDNFYHGAENWESIAIGAKSMAELRAKEQVRELDGIRAAINGLSGSAFETFESYCAVSLPQYFFDIATSPFKNVDEFNRVTIRSRDEQPKSWKQWFGELANDDQLLNFLQWHVSMLDRQQGSPEVQENIKIHKQEYGAAVRQGIAAGRLHPEAREAIGQANNVKVVIGDVLDEIIKDGAYGYHVLGSDRVVIAQGYGRKDDSVKDVKYMLREALKHELDHAVLSGLGHPIWYEEAMAEHNARVFEEGMPYELDPQLRPQEGYYPEVRSLVSTLAKCGNPNKPVSSDLFTCFYSARSPEAKRKTYTELAAGLEDSWGVKNVLIQVTNKINEYTQLLQIYRAYDDLAGGKFAGKNDMELMEEAARLVRIDLMYQPEDVFMAEKELALAS